MKDYSKSKYFCPLPWTTLTAQPDGKISVCYRNRGKDPRHMIGHISIDKISDLGNSPVIVNLRKNMIADVPSDFCIRCYEDEKTGEDSLRLSSLRQYQSKIPEFIASTDINGIYSEDIIHLTLLISNVCNLACRMCDSYGTYLRKDIDLELGFKYAYDKMQGAYETPNFCEDTQLFKSIESLHISAGEPFIDPSFYNVLGFLHSIGKAKDLELSTITNLTVLPGLTSDTSFLPKGYVDILELFSIFKKVVIGISIDGMGKDYEKIRIGGNWNTVSFHLDVLCREVQKYPNIDLVLRPVILIDNILGFPKFYVYAKKRGLKIITNFITRPEEQSIQNLPQSFKKQVVNLYTKVIGAVRGEFPEIEADLQKILVFMNTRDPKIEKILSYKKYSYVMDMYQKKQHN